MIDVLLFAKAPRPGYVKTRLAAAVGSVRAAALYRDLGRRVRDQVVPVSNVTVWYDPPDALSEMQDWLGTEGIRYQAQPSGDLGERLEYAFGRHLAGKGEGGPPTVAIGADAPDIDGNTLIRAADCLTDADVVLGPAADGGYVLIGLVRPHPTVFRDIPWGTGEVLAATRAACEREGLAVATLPTMRDVDTLTDARTMGLLS